MVSSMRSISRRRSVSDGVSERDGFAMALLRHIFAAAPIGVAGAALIGGAAGEIKENIDSGAARPI